MYTIRDLLNDYADNLNHTGALNDIRFVSPVVFDENAVPLNSKAGKTLLRTEFVFMS